MNTVTRKIDDLNRVVLPSQVKSFGWTEKTPLDITVLEDDSVMIRAHNPLCKLCGGADVELIKIENGSICNNCLQIALESKNIL